MTVFNSLGSNYDLAFALRTEMSFGSEKKRAKLIQSLNARYDLPDQGGKTTLTYKGRDAITIGLRAFDLPRGAKVAINGFTCITLYEAIVAAGMEPVLLDIEQDALDFSAHALEKALEADASIRAVIVQNTLGYPCEGKQIAALCKERGVFLIEDLAHSIGATYEDGTETGTLGDATVLSFSQDKVVDAVSGGALVMRNGKTAEAPRGRVSLSRQLQDRFYPRFTWDIRTTYPIGWGKIEHALLRGWRLLPRPLESESEPCALPLWLTPLILRQFRRLESTTAHRRAIAEIYARSLDHSLLIDTPTRTIQQSSALRFPILVPNREELLAHLRTRGIHISDTWYDAPIAPKKYASRIPYKRGTCPCAEHTAEHIVNLPTHINVSRAQAAKIAQEINRYV